jgi:hypothetical protein
MYFLHNGIRNGCVSSVRDFGFVVEPARLSYSADEHRQTDFGAAYHGVACLRLSIFLA